MLIRKRYLSVELTLCKFALASPDKGIIDAITHFMLIKEFFFASTKKVNCNYKQNGIGFPLTLSGANTPYVV